MTYVFDIDGTICSLTEGDYENASPFVDRIKKINKLHEQGNEITKSIVVNFFTLQRENDVLGTITS
jgi:predicted adenine nucleotide alpha hydrolase (AANH) superfamily ATPase